MYVGTAYCRLMQFYDLFYMIDIIRTNQSEESSKRKITLTADNINYLCTAYLGIIFNMLIQRFSTASLDQRFNERYQLIRENIKLMESVINYSQNTMGFNQTITAVEKQILDFKKRCELGASSDLFIYDFDMEEIGHYLASESNNFANLRTNLELDVFSLDKVQLTIMNYLIQFFLQIDILWEMDPGKLKLVSSLKVQYYFDRSVHLEFLGKNSLVVFISVSYSDASESL